MPMNYLMIEALERYYNFYGDTLLVEFPVIGNRIKILFFAEFLYSLFLFAFVRIRIGWNWEYAQFATNLLLFKNPIVQTLFTRYQQLDSFQWNRR